jgi:hypothetical protein
MGERDGQTLSRICFGFHVAPPVSEVGLFRMEQKQRRKRVYTCEVAQELKELSEASREELFRDRKEPFRGCRQLRGKRGH